MPVKIAWRLLVPSLSRLAMRVLATSILVPPLVALAKAPSGEQSRRLHSDLMPRVTGHNAAATLVALNKFVQSGVSWRVSLFLIGTGIFYPCPFPFLRQPDSSHYICTPPTLGCTHLAANRFAWVASWISSWVMPPESWVVRSIVTRL
jgi:hypothetical protein